MDNLRPSSVTHPPHFDIAKTAPGQIKVIRRNGTVTPFDANKIAVAMTKAFLAVEGGTAKESSRIHEKVAKLTQKIADTFNRRLQMSGTIHIEEIQDQVELELMRTAEYKVAKAYVLYREDRRRLREQEQKVKTENQAPTMHIMLPDGSIEPLDFTALTERVHTACRGLKDVDAEFIITDVRRNLFDKVPAREINKALVMSARTLIEKEPNYSYVAARLLLDDLRGEALQFLEVKEASTEEMGQRYEEYFHAYLNAGIKFELLDPKLKDFDLKIITKALKPERDAQFTYLGLQTLYDRYFIHWEGVRFELPQAFFMRVAMGLAVNEKEREKRAIEFYELLSSFDFMSSTPTLFNSGTLRPQLSSCYLTTVPDDLDGIYGAIKDNALLSKYAGGLGNDWTNVRAMGAHIKGTNGKSLGVVPFLNVANATAVAVNQCFAPETLLYTAKGIRPIATIKNGDLVLGTSGSYRAVTKTYVYNQEAPMVALHVKHALAPVRVTAGHPFYAIRNVPANTSNEALLQGLKTQQYKCEWVEAGQLQFGDYLAQTIPTEIVAVQEVGIDEARLYGILLSHGQISANGQTYLVTGECHASHFLFVKDYLSKRGISYVENQVEGTTHIEWASVRNAVRDATTGRYIESASSLPFTYDDFYDTKGQKQIAPRLSHLPETESKALLGGILEGTPRHKNMRYKTSSQPLAEGLRYQLLRLRVPTTGRKKRNPTECYEVSIPMVPNVAASLNCKAESKPTWFEYRGAIYTRVRKSTVITPVPFVCDLKVEGDVSYMTANAGLAHNGGKRKGAVCAYLETWHKDIEEFLELRKNTGDERRRTHDMNTANWIPDLFMQRMVENKDWTLFSPDETPDLHDLYGTAFNEAYTRYEEKAQQGKIKNFKKISALSLWRKMLTMLFETGHPWVTFKDPCNLRSPQQHVGTVHSSNLCTEITLNTSKDEIAVCNLGSLNLTAHMTDNGLDTKKLRRTIHTALRMLDNVIDINYYSVPQAKNSNLKHRPVGMGLMGFQDALYQMRMPYASDDAVAFADSTMEAISYFAIEASTYLAEERGTYETFAGSLWSKGILPIDSIELLAKARGGHLELDRHQTLDWTSLRDRVKNIGMRNSNVLAIAPTATISNICGVSQSIEPTYQNLFVKSNLSGEFTVINPYLVNDLKALNLWDEVMVNDLKYYNGSVAQINRIPESIKLIYATAFEVEPKWLVEAGARRQKWIDQSQSLNLYMAQPSGKKLDQLYRLAWTRGLKTTYYLRSMGATNAEKATVDDRSLNAVNVNPTAEVAEAPKACLITDPTCEACQ